MSAVNEMKGRLCAGYETFAKGYVADSFVAAWRCFLKSIDMNDIY